ncbi:MAG: hypothetical protein Crog4KO_08030 [Crocinitomicaceae bacterium]
MVFACSAITGWAQNVGINETGALPDATAILDISATDKGLLIPRTDTTTVNGGGLPATGLLIYQNNDDLFYYFDGIKWSSLLVQNQADTLPLIIDADRDTYVHTETNADEDMIRFYTSGSEHFRMENGRLEVLGNGNSVFMGRNAGDNDDQTANRNIFIGDNAGRFSVTGASNVAIGANAFENSTGTWGNVAIGRSALQNSGGQTNSAIGMNSLPALNSGVNNVAMGYRAGSIMTSGNRNVLLGNETGLNSNGSRNVFLGFRAGTNEMGDDMLYIENSLSQYPLIWGDFANDSVKIYGTLGVRNVYTFPNTDGTNGQVLSTNGAGNVSWANASIDTDDQTLSISNDSLFISDGNGVDLDSFNDTLPLIMDADQDTYVHTETNADEDMIRFYTAGTEHFRMDNGRLEVLGNGNSVFIGRNAGMNDNQSTNRNVFIGDNTGQTNTNGSENVMIGYRAGRNNVTGNRNVYLGRVAGENATGSNNVFIGNGAGRDETGSDYLYIDNANVTTPLIWGDFANNVLKVHGTLGVGNNYLFPTSDGANGQVMSTDGAGNVSWANATIDTDDQFADVFQLNGNNLELSLDGDGITTQSVDFSAFLDDTDDQFADVFQLNGNNLELSLDGDGIATQTVDFSAYLDDTDDQFADVFQLNGNNLELSLDGDGIATQTVDFSAFLDDTDDQTLTLVGNTLSIDGGNSVDLSGYVNDNLGNHSASQNISLNGNWISDDGDNEGISINTNGNVNVSNQLFFGTAGSFLNGSNQGGAIELGPTNSAGAETPFIDFHFGSGAAQDYNTRIINDGNNRLKFMTASGTAMTVLNTNVGVGVTNPTNKFQVGTNGDGTIARANAWNTFSDRRWKTNLVEIPNALEKIDSINGYYYNWIDRPDSSLQVGVMAQEIEAILPEVVATDSDGYKSVDYSKLTALLIQAVKEQQQEIQALKKENDTLANQNESALQSSQKNEAAMIEIFKRLEALENEQNNSDLLQTSVKQ